MIKDKNYELKKQYVNYLKGVPSHKFASMSIMKSQQTTKRWRDRDRDFDYQCERAISTFVDKNVKKAKPEFRLERLIREEFGPKSELELSGKININLIEDVLSTRKKKKK